jgi:hypothetical protein
MDILQCCTGSTKLAPIIYKIGGYGNTCSVNGQAGTCLDKSACASAGKVATPGYCPTDPENVQVSTIPFLTPSHNKAYLRRSVAQPTPLLAVRLSAIRPRLI